MNIIKFPGGPRKIPTVQTSIEPSSKMVIGPLTFTCTSCDQTCEADFKKMIFKTVDFHCVSCGTYFKITNPAFTTNIPKQPPKR